MSTEVKNCTISVGEVKVIWDKDASQAVLTVARALHNLTELFIKQQVEITGIKIMPNSEAQIYGHTIKND